MSQRERQTWVNKFRVAGSGVLLAIRTEINLKVQLVLAAGLLVVMACLQATLIEWCVLALAITVVLTAEAFNTSLEHLSRAITREHNEEIRQALDVAAGAVLIAAIGAVIVGLLVVVNRLAI